MTSSQLIITAVPLGDAPLWVREKWVGLSLPLAYHQSAPSAFHTVGVLDGSRGLLARLVACVTGKVRRQSGYLVEASVAIEILSATSTDAAAWWRENTPHLLRSGKCLIFDEGDGHVVAAFHKCSFCGLEASSERKLVAGSSSFICRNCVRRASAAFAENASLCGFKPSPLKAVKIWGLLVGLIAAILFVIGITKPFIEGAAEFNATNLLALLGIGVMSLIFWGAILFLIGAVPIAIIAWGIGLIARK